MPSPRPMKKVAAALAAEVCERFDLEEEARPLLSAGAAPRDFLAKLSEAGRYRAAIGFLAHAMPPREAVWWGCLCLKQAAGPELAPPESAALRAAAEWVLDPTEARRVAAKAPAEAAGVATPAGSLATAVTWTGGNLSVDMPKLPPVPPGPWLPAKGVAAAVLLASVKGDPARIEESQRQLVELGIGVAEGRHVWPDVKPVERGRTWGHPRGA